MYKKGTDKGIALSIPLTDREKAALNRFLMRTAMKKGWWVRNMIVDELQKSGDLPREAQDERA